MAHRQLPRGLTAAIHTVFVLSLLWSGFFFGWSGLRAVDFGYPLLYDALAVEEHIERFGPRNRYKRGFQTTDEAQRLALFGAIVEAIHAGGRGLESLRYRTAYGRQVQLLRTPEIVHLRSVARLLDRLRLVSGVMLAAFAGSLLLMWRLGLPPPRPKRVALWTLVAVVVGAVAVLLIGAERVFNTLHTWVFPPGEQWFFYYEESLMTTLMKAPDLFGAIAVLLLIAGLAGCTLLLWGATRLLGLTTPAPG